MDVITTRVAIIVLGITCAIGMGGSIWLAALEVKIPEVIGLVLASCSSGIVGILVQTKGANDQRHQPDFEKNPPLPSVNNSDKR